MLWPLIPYSHATINYDLERAPSPPSTENWLGTDEQARDVLARVIYGFRISMLFGLVVTALSSVIGVVAGAVQGFFGVGSICCSSASRRSGPACRNSI